MKLINGKLLGALLLLQVLVPLPAAVADDVLPARLMTLELARDIAQGAIDACRKEGYQVSVVVVDRSGRMMVLMRDVYSNHYFNELAQGKANAVVLSSVSTAELKVNRSDMIAELNLLDGVMVLRGGLPIQVAGSMIGAVGVSGAPGGDKDEACAQQGIDAVLERLDFAE
jgi:uncharacterized protein GlcG (DUF336 family)